MSVCCFSGVNHASRYAIKEGASFSILLFAAIHQHGVRHIVDLLALLAVDHFVQQNSCAGNRVKVWPNKERKARLWIVEAVDRAGIREHLHRLTDWLSCLRCKGACNHQWICTINNHYATALAFVSTGKHGAHCLTQSRELHIERTNQRGVGDRCHAGVVRQRLACYVLTVERDQNISA